MPQLKEANVQRKVNAEIARPPCVLLRQPWHGTRGKRVWAFQIAHSMGKVGQRSDGSPTMIRVSMFVCVSLFAWRSLRLIPRYSSSTRDTQLAVFSRQNTRAQECCTRRVLLGQYRDIHAYKCTTIGRCETIGEA